MAISRAVVSNIHGPRYAALPMVFVHTIAIEKPRRGILYGPGSSARSATAGQTG